MKEQNSSSRYPIGNFEYGKKYSLDETRKHIKTLSTFPKRLKKVLKKMRGESLDMPYRRGGWTVRQVVHHMADSHINAYIRFKFAVTEDNPTIKPYDEQSWAELEDAKHASVKVSLKLLAALHQRWTIFLEALSADDLKSTYYHPGSKRVIGMQEAIALYSWHSEHHLAHISIVAEGRVMDEEVVKPKKKQLQAENEPKKRGPKVKVKAPAVSAAPKRARRTPEQIAADNAVQAAAKAAEGPKKRGPKAKAPAAAVADTPKRIRRTPEQIAADNAVQAAAKAAEGPKKRGPKAKAPAAAVAATPKRIRRTPEQIAADNAAQAAAKAAEGPKKRGPKPNPDKAPQAPKAPALNADGTPKKRGMSPEHMAKIREARMAKRAAAGLAPMVTKPATTPKVKAAKAPKAPKAPKTPVVNADGTPKKRGMSPEHMAKIREARMAKRAAAGLAPMVTKPVTTPKVKAAKAPKALAVNADETPKKRGMSPEHMAKIRAARVAKRAAAGLAPMVTKPVAAPKVKVEKAPKTPVVNADETPKKRGMSPEHMEKIRAARMAKRAEAISAGTLPAPKPKKEPVLNADGTPKKRGMSPEHMEKIRAARGKKKDVN